MAWLDGTGVRSAHDKPQCGLGLPGLSWLRDLYRDPHRVA